MDLLNLPIVMVENIFSYLSYDDIARNRIVCKTFNEVCMRLLNRGFIMIERQHAISLKSVKAQLPRRESERRYHPLSRHCDILTSIETRISMLNMTYSKFIDHSICCFIPGKVIDEIRRVLELVDTQNNNNPPRAHEVLQELRDISSMAIEHFDDKISPAFRKKLQEGVAASAAQTQGGLRTGARVLGPVVLDQELMGLRRRTVMNTRLLVYFVSQYKKFYRKMMAYKKVSVRQRQTINKLTRKQIEQDNTIADLKKRIEECDIKYSELTHTNQAVGGKAIGGQSASNVASSSTQPLRHFASQIKLDLSVLPIGTSKRNQGKMLPNIKPRKPLIKLPSIVEEDARALDVDIGDGSPSKRLNMKPSTSKLARNLPGTPKPSTSAINDLSGMNKFLDSIGVNSFRLGKRSFSLSQVEDCEEEISKKFKYD